MDRRKPWRESDHIMETVCRRLLREAEAGPDDIFGRLLFAKNRKRTYLNEPDTPEEERFFKDLKQHYRGISGDNPGWVSALEGWGPQLADLVASGKYTDLLEPPSVPLYRWVTDLRFETLKKFLTNPPDALQPNEPTLTGEGVTRRSRSSSVQSWTSRLDVSVLMGLPSTDGTGDVHLLLEAHPHDNPGVFFLNPAGMKDVQFHSSVDLMVQGEDEVASIGPVRFKRSVAIRIDRQRFSSVRRAGEAMIAALTGG